MSRYYTVLEMDKVLYRYSEELEQLEDESQDRRVRGYEFDNANDSAIEGILAEFIGLMPDSLQEQVRPFLRFAMSRVYMGSHEQIEEHFRELAEAKKPTSKLTKKGLSNE